MVSRNKKDLDVLKMEAKLQQLSVASLEEGLHRDFFTRALKNVLSTEISEITLAQIVDGLPLSAVERDTYTGSGYLVADHPLHHKHKELCPGVLEKTRQLYANFDIDSINVGSKLVHEYRISAPFSRAFNMRLVELVVTSVHQIAVQLYKLDAGLHKDDGIASWEAPKENQLFWILNPNGAPPTLFQHRQYRYYEQYPDGIADGVGYWAESRIFGGVVLFDRREPSSTDKADSEGIYLHPERKNSTYRIYRLLDTQKLELIQFLLSENIAPGESPLPILGDKNNRRRVDPEEAIEATGVYRDLWERNPLGIDEQDRRLKDVIDFIDFPTDEDLEQARDRAADRRERLLFEKYGY